MIYFVCSILDFRLALVSVKKMFVKLRFYFSNVSLFKKLIPRVRILF